MSKMSGLHQGSSTIQNYEFQAQPETDVERFKRFFDNRAQDQSENAEEFLADLENLAKAAKLDEEGDGSFENNLRERFILGLKSSQAQTAVVRYLAEEETKLEGQRDYSLPKLLTIARTFEEKETIEDNYTVDNFSDVEDNKQGILPKNSSLAPQYLLNQVSFSFTEKNSRLRRERVQLSCDHCQYRCLSRVLLTSHIHLCHDTESEDVFRCNHCGAVFMTQLGLRTHKVLIHKKPKSDIYGAEWLSDVDEDDDLNGLDVLYESVDNHEVNQFDFEDRRSSSFTCSQCHFEASSMVQLRKHINTFHEDVTSRYQCKECFYRAISEDALIRHITKNHTKQTAVRLHCELCDFVSTKKTELSKHLQKNHRGEKAYVCETCGKKFQTDKTLEVHYKVVHLNEKPFACNLCDYKAGQKASLVAHNHSVHEKSKPYVCEHCGYKTTSQSTLNAHNRMVHMKSRPHTCGLCGRSFAARAGMENHIQLIHKKETPFTCEKCGKKFKRRPDLNNHIRCIHENNYFVCNICNNSFQTSRNLERHVSTVHEQMKPFSCEYCGLSFARRERLKHHIERAHQSGFANNDPALGTPGTGVVESHHSNMASPQVTQSPHLVASPHPQNLVISNVISHEHLLQQHQSDGNQVDLRHRILTTHGSPSMLLIMQQQPPHP